MLNVLAIVELGFFFFSTQTRGMSFVQIASQ